MTRCKVCTHPLREEIDKFYSQGESTRAVAKWLEDSGHPISVSRPTLQAHLTHALDPRSAFVEKVEKQPDYTIRRVAPADFLQSVVSIGAAKIESDPSKVSVDHALRAAETLERKKEDGKGALRVLVLALTGNPERDTITGEYRELPG